ncbi:MAG: (2Fe-2S) ferredoxin domain-containing protein [Magnetococcales bacterium]|nr:(2Fe-2S) ferredoxin domain-containing protein [Magnetococcales bacterium]
MKTSIMVCVKERMGQASSCVQGGSLELIRLLEREFAAQGLSVPVKPLMCFGRCNEGPNMRIAPGGAFFTRMTPERLGEVVEAVRAAVAAEGREE